MSYSDITRTSVLRAMEEYDNEGAERFLDRHGFGTSKKYILRYEGREYASKAIVGVAHGYARPDLGALASSEFSGGVYGAAKVLTDLGFEVVGPAPRAAHAVSIPVVGERTDVHRGPVANQDVVLVGCVKLKGPVAAPAEDLYVSPLFKRRRAFAERAPHWFILSALHGLVAPDQVLEPYDMKLSDQPRPYREQWGRQVVQALRGRLDGLGGRTIEIHAGSAYADAILPVLEAEGAVVRWPFRGLTQGEHLAWYGGHPAESTVALPPVQELVDRLTDESALRSAHGFPWPDVDLRHPGLYAWYVDLPGAHELTAALGHRVAPGLVYAGQAGATSSKAGKVSAATLASRIGGNHLGGGVDSSTWRRTLAALLLGPRARTEEGRAELDAWMREHLRLVVVPLPDRGHVGHLENAVLARLDPPLNLMGRPRTALRAALSERRRALRL
jgi:hypothetical protein